jgi:ADP-heptose:LPS heptosyltransferase
MTKFHKVLFIKLCCLGDIIQTTPSLRAVKESGVEVHLLCGKWVKDIAEMVPYLDKRIIMDTSSPLGYLSALMRVRAEKYDLVINLHRDLKSYVFLSLLGARERAGFSWGKGGLFLNHSFPFDSKAHETERYLSITSGLGFAAKGGHTLIRRPDIAGGKFDLSGDAIKVGIFPAGGSNPGTVMATKRWPAENFSALIKEMETSGKKVYAFGSEFDRPVIEKAIQGTGAEAVITGLKEFAYYVSFMDAFVACDTGPLHIASALGVRCIGLFGPTSPEVFGARGVNTVNLWEKTACAPCYEPATVRKREFLKCRDNICMKSITVEKAAAAIAAILSKG